MTKTTPKAGEAPLDPGMELLENVLIEFGGELETLKARVRDGDVEAVKDATKVVADIRHWMRLAKEAEAQFDQRRKESAGIEHGYALDLAHARSEIGCRLARLRRCGGSRDVSGQPE